jgi:hypothetical protein
MKRNTSARAGLVLFLTALFTAGCSDQPPTSPTSQTIRVSPADGATGVKLGEVVTIDFGRTVDRATAESGIHLIAECDIYADSMMSYHGNMDDVMNDPTMVRRMDQYDSTPGRYSWNSASTLCTFRPDSLMHSQMRYMVHLSGSMLGSIGMGGMMMGGTMNRAGDMATHFHTLSAIAP